MPAAVVIPFSPSEPTARSPKIAELRRILDEKFPRQPARREERLLTGVAAIDQHQGLPRAAVTEICGSLAGGSLLLGAFARAIWQTHSFCALVDAGRSFDCFDLHPRILKRLLWVQCQDPQQAVKAADLLMRDGNLPLVLLDLQMLPLKELRRIPASTWHRFHRLAEQGNAAFVAFTPAPMIEGARMRVAIENRWRLGAMTRRRSAILQELNLKVFDKQAFAAAFDQGLQKILKTA